MKQDRVTRRVYRWETTWAGWNSASMKLPELRALIKKALRQYKLGTIPVTTVQGRHDTEYVLWATGEKTISLNVRHKNAAIALHEAAHHICDEYFGGDLPEHSAEWLGIYLWLMHKNGVAPRVALEASAKAMNLDWAPRMSPRYVTKRTA